ncbi:hypothetical protein PENTCL1PPCAC_9586, partial [Pristionchus entomophagus]
MIAGTFLCSSPRSSISTRSPPTTTRECTRWPSRRCSSRATPCRSCCAWPPSTSSTRRYGNYVDTARELSDFFRRLTRCRRRHASPNCAPRTTRSTCSCGCAWACRTSPRSTSPPS